MALNIQLLPFAFNEAKFSFIRSIILSYISSTFVDSNIISTFDVNGIVSTIVSPVLTLVFFHFAIHKYFNFYSRF